VVVEGETASVLSGLSEPGVALAIWKRPAPRGLARWLDSLPFPQLPDGRFVATPDETPGALAALCDRVGLEETTGRSRLIADIASLTSLFARISGACRVEVRLEALDHDSCWRFHRDYTGLRLNATYRGPGTQWPPPDQASRALRSQQRYRRALNELPRFAVGLFKGVRMARKEAIVHRSPPIAGSGRTRLFLCLNEESDDA
jgi:hypothetical protein